MFSKIKTIDYCDFISVLRSLKTDDLEIRSLKKSGYLKV
jgi:hypothetical protein